MQVWFSSQIRIDMVRTKSASLRALACIRSQSFSCLEVRTVTSDSQVLLNEMIVPSRSTRLGGAIPVHHATYASDRPPAMLKKDDFFFTKPKSF